MFLESFGVLAYSVNTERGVQTRVPKEYRAALE